MPSAYPSHLYIRVDSELREALVQGAADEATSVSVFARRRLRTAVGLPAEQGLVEAFAQALSEDIHRAGAPAREVTRSIATLTNRIYGKSE